MTDLRLISSAVAKPGAATPRHPSAAFSVTAIGSCRIVGPLRIMQQSPLMILNQTGVYGYSHSSAEIRQHLSHLLSGTRPPSDLLPVLGPGSDTMDDACHRHLKSDFYVFELSSAKQISIDGHPVQLNYFNRHFRTFFANPDRTRAFWRHATQSTLADMKAFLSGLPEYKALSTQDQRLLQATRLQMTTPEDLRLDIDAIQREIEDHLFVTHFDALKTDGTPLKARAEYIAMVKDALTECGATWYDPTPSVHAFGQDLAIEDTERSLSHYSHSFEQYLCSDWWMRFIDPVREQKRLARTTRGRIRQMALAASRSANTATSSCEKV